MRHLNLSQGDFGLRDGLYETLPKGYSSLASECLTQTLPYLKEFDCDAEIIENSNRSQETHSDGKP